MPVPLQIFIAYARRDTAYLDELRTQLTPIERSGKARIWYDGKIEPGVVWETAIKENLHRADVILLLVSADAIASDYFYDKEMSDALARHATGAARVVPLIVRPCAWQATPLGELQALPKDGKAVSTWADRDDAYANAVTSLMGTLKSIQEKKDADVRRQEEEHHLAEEEIKRRRQQEEAETLRQKEAQLAAAQEAERLQKVQEQQAIQQRQLDEQRRIAATEAARRRQEEEDRRQRLAEETRQRKEEAVLNRSAQLTSFGKTLRSPLGLSSVTGAVVLAFWLMFCNKPEAALPPGEQTAADTTAAPAAPAQPVDDRLLAADTTQIIETPANSQPVAEKPKAKKTEPVAEKEKEAQPVANRKSGFEMVAVKGGTFSMGSPENEKDRQDDECQHEVTVGDFRIGKYEITQADWKEVMGSFPRELGFPGCSQCPVERVSWDDIQGFLKKASAKYGKTFRLPSEAEWEYAARGGNKSNGYTFSGSNSLGSVGWYDGNSGNKTHHVGGKAPNELGIYDMSGNVWEWCEDLWKAYPGCKASECGTCRVLRGGSWYVVAWNCRSAYRLRDYPEDRFSNGGFRVAQGW